jgi:hypothetical protein
MLQLQAKMLHAFMLKDNTRIINDLKNKYCDELRTKGDVGLLPTSPCKFFSRSISCYGTMALSISLLVSQDLQPTVADRTIKNNRPSRAFPNLLSNFAASKTL